MNASTLHTQLLKQESFFLTNTQYIKKKISVFELGVKYSESLEGLIVDQAKKSYEAIYKNSEFKDIAVFFFGSPARFEMLGDSDIDVLVVRRKETKKYRRFFDLFIDRLNTFNFCKLDIPTWGTLRDCSDFISRAITEGNQVLESRYICGDLKLAEEIKQMQNEFGNRDRYEKILAFQYFYFNQYYRQRGRKNLRNLKYGHGGTRDLLFPIWFMKLIDGITTATNRNSETLNALNFLLSNQFICYEKYLEYRKAAQDILIARNQLLRMNRHTTEDGLTFLDSIALKRLFSDPFIKRQFDYGDVRVFKRELNESINKIHELKEQVWLFFNEYLIMNKGIYFRKRFDNYNSGIITKSESLRIDKEPVILQLAALWGVGEKNRFKNIIFHKLKNSKEWVILTSLCCRNDCSPIVLDTIARKQGITRGYEYILKVIGRNKNTQRITLKYIKDCPDVEYRFKQPAIVNYKMGYKKANELM